MTDRQAAPAPPPRGAGPWQPPATGVVWAPPLPPSLPVVVSRYHQFWRTPRWSWWKSMVVVLAAATIFFVSQVGVVAAAIGYDVARNATTWQASLANLQAGHINAGFFVANNLSLALLIPAAWLASVVMGQRPRWVSSVVGRFRWRWFCSCLLVMVPGWLVFALVQLFWSRGDLHRTPDTVVMIIGILVTTPLQCAGEEFGFRGLLNRATGALFRKPLAGVMTGGLVSSLVFTIAHAAADPWLWAFYFFFGAAACWLTWRTGGLEASIAMHVVNNLTQMLALPFLDFSGMFDRSVGTASPWMLVTVAFIVIGCLTVEWRVRRAGLVAVTAPAADLRQPETCRWRP